MAEKAVRALIRGYTQEPGLRGLEREFGRVCRKIARRVVDGEKGPFNVGEEELKNYLVNNISFVLMKLNHTFCLTCNLYQNTHV